MRPYGLTALRLAVGVVFAAHGAQKLLGLWGGPGLSGTAAMVNSLGLPYPYPLAMLLTLTEFCGGILLVLGWLTPWVSLALIIDMAVAIWKGPYAQGFFVDLAETAGRGHGTEYNGVPLGAVAGPV